MDGLFNIMSSKALKGQQSIIIFFTDDASRSSLSGERRRAERRCELTYGDVIDKAARKNISICGRDVQDGRLSRLYVSQSNLLHIVFTSAASPHQQQQHSFIIHVEGTVLASTV